MTSPLTVDEILEHASNRGMFLNNLFQNVDGTWWCEWRLQIDRHRYGMKSATAATLKEALLNAMDKHEQPAKQQSNELDSLASSLNLDELLGEPPLT